MSLFKFNRKLIFLFLLSVLFVFASPLLVIFDYSIFSIFTSIIGPLLLFIFAVDLKSDRISKGVGLIFLGIFFVNFYLDFLLNLNSRHGHSYNSLRFEEIVSVFKEVLLFACAGAGGGVIANHADQSSTDKKTISEVEPIDFPTDDIDRIRYDVNAIKNRVSALIFCVATFLIILMVFFIYFFISN